MICLGIESSGKAAGVAITRDARLVYEVFLQAGLTHSETLQGLIEQALSALGLECCDIDLVGVSAGPGSFTGLRIGLAAAKGLCLAHNTQAVGVSALEALAENICAEGDILSVTDARRGEVYYALFRRSGGLVKRITEDSTAEISKLSGILEPFVQGQLYIVGDAQDLCCDTFGKAFCAVAASEPLRYPRAFGVCEAALRLAQDGGAQSAGELCPRYHRQAQAERERQEREMSID